ncbi:MAG: ion channel [Candidatus Peregrinibacteria bacterium]
MIYPKEKLEQLRHRWATTKGKKLIKTIKTSRCYLSPVLFRGKVKNFPFINDPEVEDGIDLRGIPVSGYDFRVPIKEDDGDFTEEIAILSNIHLEGATLKHCNFEEGKIHNCFFEDADLSHAGFKNATLNTCNFQQADCLGMDVNSTKLIDCNFSDANIKDMTTAMTILDQKTTFGRELKSEKERNYHFASIEYKQIKEMYKNSSLHDFADRCHCKEMAAKRKISKRTNPMRWLNYIFGDVLCKYGTSYLRVLLASTIIMVTCAAFYTKYDSLLYYSQKIESLSFADSLYFSIVTFTTLGYGDYHATNAMRFVAATESFVGAALMALFTVIIARTIIRD